MDSARLRLAARFACGLLRLRRHRALDALGGVDGVGQAPAHVRVLEQQLAGVLAPLPDPLALEGEPGAALLDDAALDAEVEQSPSIEMPRL